MKTVENGKIVHGGTVKARPKFNPNCQKDAPTVWYITKDGTLSQDEKEAVNKIRRTRKFNLDTANNRYVEVR